VNRSSNPSSRWNKHLALFTFYLLPVCLLAVFHLAIYTEIHKNADMKTTLVLPDDIFRQAKARAALKGQSFGKFLEQGLRRMLDEREETSSLASSWVRQLPRVSVGAAADLDQTFSSADFRRVDESMW
jgi:hypothetical protein